MNSLKLKYLQYLDTLMSMARFNQFQKTVEEISSEMYISVDILKNLCKIFLKSKKVLCHGTLS